MWATRLFVLPFVIIAWTFDGIRYLIRQHELNSEIYEWGGVQYKRRDRVVSVDDNDEPEFQRKMHREATGHNVDVLLGSGRTGRVKCGMGTGSGWLVIVWDPQMWQEAGSGRWIHLPSFEWEVPMENLIKA